MPKPTHVVRSPALFPEQRPLAILAEDDPDIHFAMADFLRAIGYDVTGAHDGSSFLDCLAATTGDASRDPDVIITDVRMPGINGLSIAEELRASGWRQPIIIISAYDDALLLGRARAIKCCAFFAKPLDPDLFERTLVELRVTRWPARNRVHLR